MIKFIVVASRHEAASAGREEGPRLLFASDGELEFQALGFCKFRVCDRDARCSLSSRRRGRRL
jgi:hypothetical protein